MASHEVERDFIGCSLRNIATLDIQLKGALFAISVIFMLSVL